MLKIKITIPLLLKKRSTELEESLQAISEELLRITKRSSYALLYPSAVLAGILAFTVPTIPANAVENHPVPTVSEEQDGVVLYEAETHFGEEGADTSWV